LPEVEQRISDRARKRDAAALADALLTDDERAEPRDAFNSMRVKVNGDRFGTYKSDGDVLDVTEMTPLQRKAFERMDAMQRR
jgi:hypothetical protein